MVLSAELSGWEGKGSGSERALLPYQATPRHPPLTSQLCLPNRPSCKKRLGTAAELSVRSFQWVSPGRLAHVPAQAFSPLPDPVMKCSPAPGRGTAVLGIPACTLGGLTSSAPGRRVPASRGPGRKRDQSGTSVSTYRSRIQLPLGPRGWTAGRWRRNVGGLPPREHPVLKQAEEEAEV